MRNHVSHHKARNAVFDFDASMSFGRSKVIRLLHPRSVEDPTSSGLSLQAPTCIS